MPLKTYNNMCNRFKSIILYNKICHIIFPHTVYSFPCLYFKKQISIYIKYNLSSYQTNQLNKYLTFNILIKGRVLALLVCFKKLLYTPNFAG